MKKEYSSIKQSLSELDSLRRSKQKAKLILENANDLISIHRFNDLSYVYVNPATLSTLGYSEEELKKINVVNLIHENDRMRVLKTIRRNLNSKAGKVEFRYRRKDGTFLWLEAIARLISDKEDSLLIIICRDITDRKQAEEKLQKAYEQLETKVLERTAQLKKANEELQNEIERRIITEHNLNKSENYYRTVFENTGNATAILDGDLNITKINDKFEIISGYSKEEIENRKNWIDFVSNEDCEIVMKYYNMRTKINVPKEYEICFVDKFTQIRPILISVDIIPGTSKRVISFVDISQQKQVQKDIEENLKKMHRLLNETVGSLATAVEIRDPYTAGHQKKLAQLAVAIASEMGLTKDQIDGIAVAGNLHDIGKINVPSEILSKPGRLSEVECMIVKTHCQAGYEIIKDIEFPWPVANIVLQHHERLNGTGYPQGLTGNEILLEARILAVADVIEAMASHRPYRPSLGIDMALEEISKNKGSLYDTEIVDICIKLFREKKFTWNGLPLN